MNLLKERLHQCLSQLDVYSSVYHVVHPYGGVPFQNVVSSACDRGIKMDGIPFEQWRVG